MTCKHRSTTERSIRCFAGSVAEPHKQVLSAHGNITVTVQCLRCGATQRRNINGRHVERGPWQPEYDDADMDQ